tara:strand:+ start:13611 stop:13853 length:243 start_codon:yes stop_codon:yes gene_type:complete
MIAIGLILLIASSWYIWKLSSSYLDEKTKMELKESWQKSKQLAIKNNPFSIQKWEKALEGYKQEMNKAINSKKGSKKNID